VFICCVYCGVSLLAVYSYSELHTKCVYRKGKENVIHYFQMLFVFNFFTINTVYSRIVTVRTADGLITLMIKQFTSGTSYLMNGRLHFSVRTGYMFRSVQATCFGPYRLHE
jgi:hypothetical protein